MDTEQTLLEALHADPGDDTARLALADRLEEQGHASRAELSRLRRATGPPRSATGDRRVPRGGSWNDRFRVVLEHGR